MRRMRPARTMLPRTASTVVGLTSGRMRQMSAFESGVNEPNTVFSMRDFFVTRFASTEAKRLSSSL